MLRRLSSSIGDIAYWEWMCENEWLSHGCK